MFIVNTIIKWGSFATANCCLLVLNQIVFKAIKQQLMIQKLPHVLAHGHFGG
jgi:hypothetical protein